MRDRRFVAEHRGGPLRLQEHRALAAWAAECAEHVLAHFERARNSDDRPRRAIDTARAWSRGEATVGAAQKASVAAHAAARDAEAVDLTAAVSAARAAGHAVATAHSADHALGAAVYAVRAVVALGESPAAERDWQIEKLPAAVRRLVVSALDGPRFQATHAKPPAADRATTA